MIENAYVASCDNCLKSLGHTLLDKKRAKERLVSLGWYVGRDGKCYCCVDCFLLGKLRAFKAAKGAA